MSRVSDSLYGADIAKPLTTGATNDQLAASVRAVIDALRASGVVVEDPSTTDAA